MRNGSGHQGENGRQWRTSEQEQTQHFLHKTCKWEVSRLSNAKKKCAAGAKCFFFPNYTIFVVVVFLTISLSSLFL